MMCESNFLLLFNKLLPRKKAFKLAFAFEIGVTYLSGYARLQATLNGFKILELNLKLADF